MEKYLIFGNNCSVSDAECTYFAKIMQNGAVKLGFGVGVNSGQRCCYPRARLSENARVAKFSPTDNEK